MKVLNDFTFHLPLDSDAKNVAYSLDLEPLQIFISFRTVPCGKRCKLEGNIAD